MEFVKLIVEDEVAKITINRENALNALNSQVMRELDEIITILHQKVTEFRVVLITGAGNKAFVAGADIGEMVKFSPFEAKAFLSNGQKVLNRIENFPRPVVALVNGYALGGGLELALACDIRLATENAKLGLPEVTLGLIPSFGGTQRLTRCLGMSRAKSMILQAKTLSASEALQIGLVDSVFSIDTASEEVIKVISKLKNLAPRALSAAKVSINAASSTDFTSGLEIEVNQASLCFSSDDLCEGMNAFLEKRKPKFTDLDS